MTMHDRAASANMESSGHQQKVCFVTVGATAPFDTLIVEVIAAPFLKALAAKNYTHLIIQHGHCSDSVRFQFDEAKKFVAEHLSSKLSIHGFEFKENLETDLFQVKNTPERGIEEGVVLSHAGMLIIYHCSSLASLNVDKLT